jgi:predicted protein tyrosine phosphatase
MIELVRYMSQANAEKLLPMLDTALISITEPGELANLNPGWKNLLRLEFHDSDTENFVGCVLFDEAMALKIITLIQSLPEDVKHVMVHCHAGISRSAAVAKFVAETVNAPFSEQYALYNKHVYRVLRRTFFEKELGEIYFNDKAVAKVMARR